MYDQNDYLSAARVCASVKVCDLQPGDVVWVPDPDPSNPWRQMVEILAVGATGWAEVRPAGGQGIRGPKDCGLLPVGRPRVEVKLAHLLAHHDCLDR